MSHRKVDGVIRNVEGHRTDKTPSTTAAQTQMFLCTVPSFLLTVMFLKVIEAMTGGSEAVSFPTNISASSSYKFFGDNSTTVFGLRAAYSWKTLIDIVTELNANYDDRRLYRIIILGRHGQGVHNIAETKYGSEEWDRKWSKLKGDDELTWGPDARLTMQGIAQARSDCMKWHKQMTSGLPFPAIKYSSPLSRALMTARLTFNISGMDDRLDVLEDLRESIGVHTCDRRSTKTDLHARFPEAFFEDDFSEEDPSWQADTRESDAHIRERARRALEAIMARECDVSRRKSSSFDQSRDRILSITSHSGFLRNLFAELGLPPRKFDTGAVTGLLVDAICEPETIVSTGQWTDDESDVKRIFLIQ